MPHPYDFEAVRLTKETGYYHYSDYDDVACQMVIRRTPFQNTKEKMCRQFVRFVKKHGLPDMAVEELIEFVKSQHGKYKPEVLHWLKRYYAFWGNAEQDAEQLERCVKRLAAEARQSTAS